ncbi:phosphoglycerate mutase [Trypanosoma grayi]|uniref:phosphoglycerate mutase n=1 Tax=Trypanosoma grayi TaxID=71804 RepID=UPI0004F4020A|nr:phosphoglycerate mutase [Trypanosoma grayi]KEG08611.1 phosphoglycerate mutase [Trypanosoma grayi]
MLRWTLQRACAKGKHPSVGASLADAASAAASSSSSSSFPTLSTSSSSTSSFAPPASVAFVTHADDGNKMSITIRSGGNRRPLKAATQLPEPVKRIMFVRGGKSLANVDIGTYVTTPDWRIPIVPEGEEESYRAGRRVAEIVGNESVYFYFSPYLRSRQSFKHMLRGYDDYRSDTKMEGEHIIGVREDVRLRDGDIGRYKTKEEVLFHLEQREVYGKFFYRFPYGESGADVCDRVTSFLDAFQRERLYFPMDTNVVIVTHGQTIRMFMKRWFHLTVETYHMMVSPPPGSISTLTRMHHRSRFRLDDSCVEAMKLPLSLNEFNGYKYRNKQLLGSMSTGAPFM